MMLPSQEKYLIIGLGNPGRDYLHNRHNVGYMVINEYLKSTGIKISKMKYGFGVETPRAIFLMPDTFMNNSGTAVKHYLAKIGGDSNKLCVVQDDMDIELGRVILKFNGGDNGHNGIKSINNSIRTNKYYRIRIGVGRPPEGMEPADYLLSDFLPNELEAIKNGIKKASDGLDIIIKDGFIKAMNQINKTKRQNKKEENINGERI
ncbi:MAG: aminoacyl-tRNA hydrolase [Deltaproteobacteria bacterium]|nr:aminoacyl-tRNA hydrolase [Deltaproteobacteria bacterium]